MRPVAPQPLRQVQIDAQNIADLIAFHDITMLETLDFDYTPFPKIQKWVARMRQEPYIQKANEQFEASKENIKSLRRKPDPKL